MNAHFRSEEHQPDVWAWPSQRAASRRVSPRSLGLEELQRLAGNCAVVRLVQPAPMPFPTVQPAEGVPPAPAFGGSDQEAYSPDFVKDLAPGIATFARALASLGGWMTAYHVVMQLKRARSTRDMLEVIIRAGFFGALLHEDVAAEVIPQSWLIALAQREVDAKGPLARRHLDHYLLGSGDDFVEDVARLYRDDDGFRAATERMIVEAEALDGTLALAQGDFTNPEWKYSLGAVDTVSYELVERRDDTHANVRIVLRDRYEWHPHEYRDWGSHIAHVALERAKENGARDYWEVGEAIVALRVGRRLAERRQSTPSP